MEILIDICLLFLAYTPKEKPCHLNINENTTLVFKNTEVDLMYLNKKVATFREENGEYYLIYQNNTEKFENLREGLKKFLSLKREVICGD